MRVRRVSAAIFDDAVAHRDRPRKQVNVVRHYHLTVVLAGALCVLPSAASGQNEPASPIFDVPPDGKVTLTVNGRPVSAFSAPGMPSELYLSRSYATALLGNGADLPVVTKPKKGFSLFSIRRVTDDERSGPITKNIGPVIVKGYSKHVSLGFGSEVAHGMAQWFDTDAYSFGDALAGPYAIPSSVVRFRLLEPTVDEVVSSVPLADKHSSWWLASTIKRIGNKNVHFAFAPQFKTTVASAAAGALIARDHRGLFSGKPESVLISHGVERPARAVRLSQPLRLGAIVIDNLLVRTRDYGSAASIVEGEQPDLSEVTDEIVVTGSRKASAPEYIVYVGADALGGCSSIVYDKPAKVITLSCRRKIPIL